MKPGKPGDNISPAQPNELSVGPEIKKMIDQVAMRNRIFISIPIGCLLCTIISAIFDGGAACLFGAAAFVSTVAMISYVSIGSSKFKLKYRQTIVHSFLKNAFGDIEYEPQNFLDLTVFYHSGLSAVAPNSYEANNYLKIKNPDYLFESTYMFATKVRRSSDNSNSTSSELVHMGLYFRYSFKANFPAEIIILNDTSGLSWANLNGGPDYIFNLYAKTPINNKVFEKEFEVYSKDPDKALEFLSVDMQKFLIDLKERLNTKVEVSFMGDCMHISIYKEREIFQPGFVLFSNGSPIKRTAAEVKWLKDLVDFMHPTMQNLSNKYGY